MRKFEIGYEDECLGVFYGENEQEAIAEMKDYMASYNFKPDTKDRLRKGLIIREVL